MEPEVLVALEQLPAAERRVIDLLIQQGRSIPETARIVGKSEGHVVVTFSKGLAALRKIRRDLEHVPGGGVELANFLKTAAATVKSEVHK
jgi:DNA-directed RNA polymerase specialized sigma24 family protein